MVQLYIQNISTNSFIVYKFTTTEPFPSDAHKLFVLYVSSATIKRASIAYKTAQVIRSTSTQPQPNQISERSQSRKNPSLISKTFGEPFSCNFFVDTPK